MTRKEMAQRRKRYQDIGQILVSNGFDWLMTDSYFGEILGRVRKRAGRPKAPSITQPERMRKTLEELGPTFVKLGQALSTRPDLLPADYTAELIKLQDQAPRVDYSEISAVIQRELGSPPDEVFQVFDVEPRAAASVGQVHNAILQDGTRVVVKIQRPGIQPIIEEDLAILADLARLLSKNSPIGKLYDLIGWVDDFAYTLRNELDYTREGSNADRIREDFAEDPSLHVPTIYWEYTTKTVLTMEEISGIKISDIAALEAAGIDHRELAKRSAHIAVTQVLDHGFFHADPHPGNFFVLPDGTIAMIDYGMMGQLEDRLRQSLARLSLAFIRQDPDRIIDELMTLGAAPGPIDRQALRRDLGRALQQYYDLNLGDLTAAQIFNDSNSLSRRHHLQLPGDLTLLIRVAAMHESIGVSLDPEFNLPEFAKPYLKRFWQRTHSLHVMTRRARQGAIEMAEMTLDLPQRIRHFLVQMDRGELTVTSRLEISEESSKRLQEAVNRVSISIIAGATTIGLSVLASLYRPVGSHGFFHFVLRATLVLGIACCVWLFGAFWRSRQ